MPLCYNKVIKLVTTYEKIAVVTMHTLCIATRLIPGSICFGIQMVQVFQKLVCTILQYTKDGISIVIDRTFAYRQCQNTVEHILRECIFAHFLQV